MLRAYESSPLNTDMEQKVEFDLWPLHHVDGGRIPGVMEVYAATVFSVEEVGWVDSAWSLRGEEWMQVASVS